MGGGGAKAYLIGNYRYIHMQSIANILNGKKIEVTEEAKRERNYTYDILHEKGSKLYLPTTFLLRLLKKYNLQDVERMLSWLSDYPKIDLSKPPIGLAYWFLKNYALAKSK